MFFKSKCTSNNQATEVRKLSLAIFDDTKSCSKTWRKVSMIQWLVRNVLLQRIAQTSHSIKLPQLLHTHKYFYLCLVAVTFIFH